MTIDLAVIGAQRAGSTRLADTLAAHPGLELPALELPVFEERFFSALALVELDKYYTDSSGVLRGLKRPDYLADPGAAENLHRVNSSCILTVVLRDPVERFVSALHWYQYVKLIPVEPMSEILAQVRAVADTAVEKAWAGNPYANLLSNGMYGRHLLRWLELFGEDCLHILTQEQLRNASSRDAAVNRIFSALGLATQPAATGGKPQRQNAGVYNPHRLKFLSKRPTTFRWEDMSKFEYVPSRLRRSPVRAVVSRGFHAVDQYALAPLCKKSEALTESDLDFLRTLYWNDRVTSGCTSLLDGVSIGGQRAQ